MKLSTSVFLPLFMGALVAEVAFAHHDKQCDSKKPHHKKHHKHHHHKHHHHNDSEHREESQTTVVKGTNYDSSDGAYGGSSSTPKSVSQHHGSAHKGHNGSNPFGGKACIGGTEALDLLRDDIYLAHDWNTELYPGQKAGKVKFAATLYGTGKTGRHQDVKSWHDFMTKPADEWEVCIGFNEFDFEGAASAGVMPADEAARKWDQAMRARKEAGCILISPSCAKQLDENLMGPFLEKAQVKPHFVNAHIFNDNAEVIKKVLDHYRQFGYKIVVTEFACINFVKNKQCNQEETIQFIYRAVEIFENDPDVVSYCYADAANGEFCHLSKNGKLTKTGWAFKDAIGKYSKRNKMYSKREVFNISQLD